MAHHLFNVLVEDPRYWTQKLVNVVSSRLILPHKPEYFNFITKSRGIDVIVSASFPSGHAMISAVVYLTLVALLAKIVITNTFKIHLRTVAVLLTVMIGLSRVYLGVHWRTDVLETRIDPLHPDQHPEIGAVKDMAAGAVLVSSLIAVAEALVFVRVQLDF